MRFNTEDIDEGMKNYFKSIKHFKTLKREEEHRLLEAYKKHNDLNARNKLIEANLKYACKLANTYRGRGLSFNELVTEANDGLFEAIKRFDIDKDVKFISYSKWWIIQKIQKAIRERNMVDGRDISEFNKLTDSDDSNSEDVNLVYEEMDETYNTDIDVLLETLMDKLTDRERNMIYSYYGIYSRPKKTLDEIGNDYGLTKERVRQIIEKALLKVKTEALLVDNVYLS